MIYKRITDSPILTVLWLTIVISTVEFLLVLLLESIPAFELLSPVPHALVDALVLVTAIIPVLYLYVTKQKRAEEELKKHRDHLEELVKERTTELEKEIIERKRLNKEQERLIQQLQESLDKVKTLSGLIPICASCKKIRDDEGYWHAVEAYIGKHSEADFTHGICPECLKKLYPEYYKPEE